MVRMLAYFSSRSRGWQTSSTNPFGPHKMITRSSSAKLQSNQKEVSCIKKKCCAAVNRKTHKTLSDSKVKCRQLEGKSPQWHPSSASHSCMPCLASMCWTYWLGMLGVLFTMYDPDHLWSGTPTKILLQAFTVWHWSFQSPLCLPRGQMCNCAMRCQASLSQWVVPGRLQPDQHLCNSNKEWFKKNMMIREDSHDMLCASFDLIMYNHVQWFSTFLSHRGKGLSSMLRIAWMIENSLITSLFAFGLAKLDRHSSRHWRSNDKTGVMPDPPAKAWDSFPVFPESVHNQSLVNLPDVKGEEIDSKLMKECTRDNLYQFMSITYLHILNWYWTSVRMPSNTNGGGFDQLAINNKVSISTIDLAAMRSREPHFFSCRCDPRPYSQYPLRKALNQGTDGYGKILPLYHVPAWYSMMLCCRFGSPSLTSRHSFVLPLPPSAKPPAASLGYSFTCLRATAQDHTLINCC